jgi:hypothetical protein
MMTPVGQHVLLHDDAAEQCILHSAQNQNALQQVWEQEAAAARRGAQLATQQHLRLTSG